MTTQAALRRGLREELVEQLEVRAGRAEAVLARMARDSRASLIVVGGKRRGVFARWVAGSTAHRLVRIADVPVLVTAGAPAEVRRLLVVADPRGREAHTVEVAKQFARLFEASLQIMYQGDFLPEIRHVPNRRATFLEQRTGDMDETAEVNGAEPTARSAVREGPRLGTIIDEILYSNVDVAVVGSHGKTCTGRKLLAGTVGGLLHDLPTSLLIVPSSASRQSFC